MNGINKIFIAGVIQGSHQDKTIHAQSYRQELRTLLSSTFPEAVIYDPFEGHENSIEYDDNQGRATFLSGIKAVLDSDLVIAYLPHASLGTAIEVWESHKKGIPVWTISPMKTNWVVRFCSDKVFESIDDFATFLQNHYSIVEK